MDFMNCKIEDDSARITLFTAKYNNIKQLNELLDVVRQVKPKASKIDLRFDIAGKKTNGIHEMIPWIIEHTKEDDKFLRKIEVINSNFIDRLFYRAFKKTIDKRICDRIVFL